MTDGYVRVFNEELDEKNELPIEDDNTLLLSTLTTLFPGSTGLRYKTVDTDVCRGLRCVDGKIYPPQEGWDSFVFHAVYPKDNYKRKGEEECSPSTKNKKVDRKRCTDMIVLGMSYKTDEETMRQYYSQYGQLAMVQLKRNPVTQQSRGYGFIRFVDYGSQVSCLSDKHVLDGRTCEVKIPNSKIEGDRQEVSKKIYVGNLNESVTREELRDFFSEYGLVTDVFLPKPLRGFAFVTFADADVAQSLLNKSLKMDNIELSVNSAAPKLPTQMKNYQNMMMDGQMMSRGYGQHPQGGGMQGYRGGQMHNGSGGNIGHPGGYHDSWNASYAVQQFPNQGTPQHGTLEQNTNAFAALSMLNNPNVLNTLMSIVGQQPSQAAGSAGQHTGVSAVSGSVMQAGGPPSSSPSQAAGSAFMGHANHNMDPYQNRHSKY